MHIEIWQSPARMIEQGWHWHIKARNGRIIADAEAFPTKANAMRAAKATVRSIIRECDRDLNIEFYKYMRAGRLILTWI